MRLPCAAWWRGRSTAASAPRPAGCRRLRAAARLAQYGRNELPPAHRRWVGFQFLAQFTDLFAVVLEVASAIMFVAWLVRPSDIGNLQLALAILAVVVLNATIGFFQEYSAERTAEALQAMVPKASRVIREGERVEVPATQLVPGDVVVLEAGDAVSADARVVEAHDLTVNMAALTGESQPLSRTSEPSATADALESRNLVFMGTSVAGGTGKAVVTATGGATEFGRIYGLTAGVKEWKSPLQREVARMARQVATAAISIGIGLFVLRLATGSPLVESFVFALGVMVALVPEGLPATLSVSLAIGVRRMARRAALIKKLLAVETLGSTTIICTDKTGTLTTAEMTVQALWASGRRHAVTGIGYEPTGSVEGGKEPRDLLRAAALCSDARVMSPARPGGWAGGSLVTPPRGRSWSRRSRDDEDNLVIGLLAKRQFRVPRVVARINDPENASLFGETWGIDAAVSAPITLMSLIEEATRAADTVGLMRLSAAGVVLIETTLTKSSTATGKAVSQIPLPRGSQVAAVIRRGKPTVPDRSFKLATGDEILIVSESATVADARSLFQ